MIVIISSISVQAQKNENSNYSVAKKYKEIDRPWYVSIDATSFLLRGYGFAIGRQLTNFVTAELFASAMNLKESDYENSILSTKHEVKQMGVRSNYLFNGVNESGIYLGAALGQVSAKSTGRMKILSDTPVENSVTSSVALVQGFAGYQAVGRSFSSSSLVFRFGAGYGSGNSYSVNYGGTKNEIGSGLMFELRGGVMF